MIQTQLTADMSSIEDMLDNLKAKAPNVLRNAINRTVTNVKKNIAMKTSSMYFIKSSDVKKTIKISKATKTKLCGIVKSSSGMIALSKFRVTPNRAVSYKNGKPNPRFYKAGVKRAGGVKKLDKSPRAFITTMKSGHVGVFERTSKQSFPIRQLYGPSVPQMVENNLIIKKITEDANITLSKRIEAEVNYLLSKG